MSMELLAAFLLAAVSYALLPGPGTVYIAVQAIKGDLRAAVWGALGLHVGGYVIVLAAAGGLTFLFTAVPVLYQGLKLLGAAYLVWLGIGLIADRVGREQKSPDGDKARHPVTFSQGVLVEILNPTTVVFYVAFLPQFIVPDAGLPVWGQFLLLGVVVNLIFSLGDVLTIALTEKLKTGVVSSASGRRVLGWIGGSALIALGARLVVDRG